MWDVVNEALNEDGTLRQTVFLEMMGDEYIEKAFQYANDTDPNVELAYNDYNLYKPKKREGAIRIINSLKEKGIRFRKTDKAESRCSASIETLLPAMKIKPKVRAYHK